MYPCQGSQKFGNGVLQCEMLEWRLRFGAFMLNLSSESAALADIRDLVALEWQ